MSITVEASAIVRNFQERELEALGIAAEARARFEETGEQTDAMTDVFWRGVASAFEAAPEMLSEGGGQS